MDITSDYLYLEHHIYSNQIKQSLEIVYNYIKKNDLILVGGEAMNFALKLKGSEIYNKYSIADYDCISPDFYTHAKNITSILCNKDFPNVNMMPAVHNTTVRVKVSNYTIFDSTYCPENIYNNIKKIDYKGLSIIHPDYQKIDQYNSLSFLFEKTGFTQNIYHRMEKDILRNKLLVEFYPIDDKVIEIKKIQQELPISLIKCQDYKTYKLDTYSYIESNNNICCHGFLGYSIYYQDIFNKFQKYKYIISKKDMENIDNLFKKIQPSSFIIKNNKCNFLIPENIPITFINGNNKIDEIEKDINKLYKIKKIEIFNKLLEVKPISKLYHIDNKNIEIYDLTGKLLSCNLFNINHTDIIVSNYNYLLSYFLMNYYFYNQYNYLQYYTSLLNIIEIAKILNEYKEINTELNNYNFSISTYGKYNYNESFYYFINNFNYLIENNKNSPDKPGKIYTQFPECVVDKEFDINSSQYFEIDGKINANIESTNNIYILEKNNIV